MPSITISTEVLGVHKDWELSQSALLDMGIFEDEFNELRQYLNEWDGLNDSAGRWEEQVQNAIIRVLETGQPKNLTLAMGMVGDDEDAVDYSDHDISIHIKKID